MFMRQASERDILFILGVFWSGRTFEQAEQQEQDRCIQNWYVEQAA